MTFDPYVPYGPLVESTVRVVTWNVWGRYGPAWETRQAALEDTLAEVSPDVICLVEAWRHGESSQPGRIAGRLELPYYHFVGDWQQEDWVSGVGLVCRWPMSEPRRRPLRSEDGVGTGEAVHVVVDGERGTIQLFAVMLDYPLGASSIRQAQVKQLASFIREVTSNRDLVIVCGDFNAGPDSDEIRMLTGRSATASPGLVFYDSWEVAGDGSPGYTWSNRNPSPPSACTRTGASTTSFPPGRGAMAPSTRPAVRCSASGHLARIRYLTTMGWSWTFATKPSAVRWRPALRKQDAVVNQPVSYPDRPQRRASPARAADGG